MHVLLDENLPHALAAELTGHEVSSVQAEGWAGTENGALLEQASEHFDALLSMDRGLAHQQNPSRLGVRILIIRAPSNRMVDLRPVVDSILTTLAAMRPGQLEVVQSPDGKIGNQAKAPSGRRGPGERKSPQPGGDPAVAAPPPRPQTKPRKASGRQQTPKPGNGGHDH